MMTKQHFQIIAGAMYLCRPQSGDPAEWRNTCERLADMCERENPRFDRGKFMRACEGR